MALLLYLNTYLKEKRLFFPLNEISIIIKLCSIKTTSIANYYKGVIGGL